jgi:hypothetical protein
MNAPAPKFMIESAWHGMIFTSGWKPANGGLDVLKPATRAVPTRVGNVARAATGYRGFDTSGMIRCARVPGRSRHKTPEGDVS